jgi:hypothetical protein
LIGGLDASLLDTLERFQEAEQTFNEIEPKFFDAVLYHDRKARAKIYPILHYESKRMMALEGYYNWLLKVKEVVTRN